MNTDTSENDMTQGEELRKAFEITQMYTNIDFHAVPMEMRKELSLEILLSTMRLTTRATCNNRSEFEIRANELIDKIGSGGEAVLDKLESVFLKAYAQFLRVEDDEE